MLIINAVHANSAGRLADAGLLGTFGFRYGPLPTWIYQLLTAITHDLVALTVLHAVLMMAATAAALWWLSRSLRLWPGFAVVPLVSPYLWFYARLLWDNPFVIPIGTLAVAAYAAHLTSGSAWGLRIALAAMIGVSMIHLMALALVLPMALHMIVVCRKELWADRVAVVAVVCVALVAAWPYWHLLATNPGNPAVRDWRDVSIDGLLLPLRGARVLSARELDYFFGPAPVEGPTIAAAASISSLVYVLTWAGMAVAISLVWRAFASGRWSAREHIAIVLLAALVCQAIVGGISGKFEHPQYSNGTWVACVFFSWLGVDFAVGRRSLRWLAVGATMVVVVALIVATATVSGRLHRTFGTREVYGPTIGNQQAVARLIAEFPSDVNVEPHIEMYDRFPHALGVLRELNPPRGIRPRPGALVIRYSSEDPKSGAIQLIVR